MRRSVSVAISTRIMNGISFEELNHGAVFGALAQNEDVRRLVAEVKAGARSVSLAGMPQTAARALVLALLQQLTGKQFAVVTQAQTELETWQRDISFWYSILRGRRESGDAVLSLPASESDPYAGASPHAETMERRALTLWRLAGGVQSDFILLTARGIARRTIAPAEILNSGARLKRDADFSPEKLVHNLLAAGYVREDPVGAVGEFSMRGGILDVWSAGRAHPVRIEFFGDTVDSLREFDPETQLSVAQLKEVEIVPLREITATADDFRLWAMLAREHWTDERFTRALRDRTSYADDGETFAGWEWLMPLVHERRSDIFAYLKDAVFVVDEPGAIDGYLAQTYETLQARYAETETADDIALPPETYYLPAAELRARLGEKQMLELRALGRAAAATDNALALAAEAPTITIGKPREVAKPLFLFPGADDAPEIEIKAQTLPARSNDDADRRRRRCFLHTVRAWQSASRKFCANMKPARSACSAKN